MTEPAEKLTRIVSLIPHPSVVMSCKGRHHCERGRCMLCTHRGMEVGNVFVLGNSCGFV